MINRNRLFSRGGRIPYLITGSLVLPVMATWLVFVRRDPGPDQQVFQWVEPMHHTSVTAFMKAISFLGNHRFLIPANLLLIFFLIWRGNKHLAARITLVALSSLALMSALKNLFRRNRPEDALVPGITNFSFPSGHALMSVVFFGSLIWLAYRSPQPNGWRMPFMLGCMVMVLLIGFSRIYLRVHYASDVVAGLGFGSAWLACCLLITRRQSTRQGL